MDPGKALIASLEVIKVLYETAELYNRLEIINGEILNEIAILVALQDQIMSSQRMANNQIVNNYLSDINRKLTKIKTMTENIGSKNMFSKIIYTRKIKKITIQLSSMIKKLKNLLELKKEMMQSSKMDVANIISDEGGRAFWDKTFGSENIFVQQNLFFGALRLHTKLLSTEIDFLKRVVNDDKDKYISAFEFQEWLDFFGGFEVVMRRTIDSLFDVQTYDIVEWYHPSINKNLVRAYLYDKDFIVRKHATQRGVFIVNYKVISPSHPSSQPSSSSLAPSRPPSPPAFDIYTIYIQNRENMFHIQRTADMLPMEQEVLRRLDITTSLTLQDIVLRLNAVISQIIGIDMQQTNTNIPSWDQERKSLMDADISQMFSLNGSPGSGSVNDKPGIGIGSFASSAIDAASGAFTSIMDGASGAYDNIVNTIPSAFSAFIPCSSDRRQNKTKNG
jgi:hypothetical protein